jgi:hypothetical protein
MLSSSPLTRLTVVPAVFHVHGRLRRRHGRSSQDPRYRKLTYGFRVTARFISRLTSDPFEVLCVKFGLIKTHQRTLVWTKRHNPESEIRTRPSRSAPLHATSPSIELTLYPEAPHDESAIQDTPATAHSLFPPAQTNRRTRNESDASYTEPPLPIYQQYRRSDDSRRSLVQQPPDVHRSRV